MVAFEPPAASREGVDNKFYCPTSFLQDKDIVEGLAAQLQQISGKAPRWRASALDLIKRVALEFHQDQPARHGSDERQAQKFLIASPPQYVSLAVYRFL